MRHLSLSIFFVFFAIFSNAQNNLVTVIATGDGISEAQATNRALRNAIEKTFGVFISASTQIKNDELISDEIASVASGNIASYDVLSSIQNGSSFVVSVKALISPEKVVLNLNTAGQKVELNGSLFAQNILVEKFYKDQEVQVIKDFIETYKNFKIIDSFSIYLCEPFFMNFPKLEYEGNEIIRKFIFNIAPEVKSGICFDDYVTPYNNGDSYYRNIYYSYLTREKQIKFYDGLFTRESTLNELQEAKILNDLSGPNYLLPVIYRPIYNVSKAVTLTNAFSKLLSVISIKDIENYNKKLGESFSLDFIGLEKEVEFKGDIIKIISNNSKTTFPFKEWAKKRFKAVYNLRNSESINLLINFFNTQFYYTSPDNLYVNNESGFTKSIHLVLTHKELKKFANSKTSYSLSNTIDITPAYSNNGYRDNNYYGNAISFSLYPSIILFRLTLEDLGKFKGLDFSFKN